MASALLLTLVVGLPVGLCAAALPEPIHRVALIVPLSALASAGLFRLVMRDGIRRRGQCLLLACCLTCTVQAAYVTARIQRDRVAYHSRIAAALESQDAEVASLVMTPSVETRTLLRTRLLRHAGPFGVRDVLPAVGVYLVELLASIWLVGLVLRTADELEEETDAC